MSRVATVAVCSLAVIGLGCGGGSDAPSFDQQLREVADSVDRPVRRLSRALAATSPRSRSQLIELRAIASRASNDLDDARADLRALEPDEAADRKVQRSTLDAIESLGELADSLSRPTPSVDALEQASAQARLAAEDVEGVVLPELDASEFIRALRVERRRQAKRKAAKTTSPGVSQPVGPDPGGASGGSASVSYFNYNGPAFQAKLPTGGGWASPASSEPTPGQLFRTSVRGPNGAFVIVDFTPFETAKFGGSYSSRRQVGQTAFGSATEYIFQGGRLPECQRDRCVDYIINDARSGQGFGVLAGGPDFALAQSIARTVMESLTPRGDY
jgi:hypothetical protein